MSKKIFFLILSCGLFFASQKIHARENVTNWYIQDFETTIIVNSDSTLDITERITADCGNAQGKHGIFRILPQEIKLTTGEKIETPIELLSISDFSGNELKYSQIKNKIDKTVTWKIGDANQTVKGVNTYEIRYRIKNAIRFGSEEFDELYWNLNGNFWDIETDKFSAEIFFPIEINEKNAQVEYYTGYLGEKRKDLASFIWKDNVLKFNSLKTLKVKEGITASVIFPKNIISPYQPTFFEKYGEYLFFLLPLFIFILCFYLWSKYGKDPRVNKPLIAEYEIPDNLSPIELGMLMKNGGFDNSFITAEIINFAVKGLMTIKELNEKILFFNSKDYEFIRTEKGKFPENLSQAQRTIFEKISSSSKTIKLSSLKNRFQIILQDTKSQTNDLLVEKNLIVRSGNNFRIIFIIIGVVLMISSVSFFEFYFNFFMSLILSGIFFLLFGLIMPKRTPIGAELNWKIKGFKLFMETVDKDRARFYEKENIFEKFLPYAIVFGITDIWINRMKEIYGEEYFNTYAPIWYTGNLGNFNAESFTNTMDSLSSSIASNTSSPSGAGGSGGSGGGGGGGGGGGW